MLPAPTHRTDTNLPEAIGRYTRGLCQRILATMLLSGAMTVLGCSGAVNRDAPQRAVPGPMGALENLTSDAVKDVDRPRIFLAHKARSGLIQADMKSAGIEFTDRGYDTVVFNVGSTDKARLIEQIKSELAASRQVILDSDGGETEMTAVSDIAKAVAGLGTKSEGVLLQKIEGEVFSVIPLEAEATYLRRQIHAGKRISAGNTVIYALGIK